MAETKRAEAGEESRELLSLGKPWSRQLVADAGALPDIVRRAGSAAVFAAEEFNDESQP